MSERYFPGFTFREFKPSKPFEIRMIPSKNTDETSPITEREIVIVNFEDIFGPTPTSHDIVEDRSKIWNPVQLQKDFTNQLSQIDAQIRYPRLTMRRRTMLFVTPDEMRPKTKRERQYLIKRYGEYIADGGAGDCTRNADGTFTLRIGILGKEDTTSKDEALALIGHEYGHTLGERLEDSVLEELKAYTFANLLMRYYYNVDKNLVSQMEVSTVHETALFWLEQLTEKNITEEAILAHLTGRKFGQYYPNDYLKFI